MGKKSQKNPNNTYGYYHNTSGKSLLGISFAENPEQRELIRLMNETSKPIIFCVGDAGTGKTFTALTAAIDLVKVQRKYSRIFYIREPIEVGRSLGFLPGTLDEKFNVYLEGMMDNLEVISEYSGINVNDMRQTVECMPPQYIRRKIYF